MYKNGINLVHYLIELFLIRVRIWALKIVTKRYTYFLVTYLSFGEKIALPYLADLLAFSDEESLKEFIISSGNIKFFTEIKDGVLTEDKSALNNKESFKIYNDHPWMKLKLKILKHF